MSHHKSRANPESPVGASLLAKAFDQPTSLLPDPPPSRASSLLHWLSVTPKNPDVIPNPRGSEPAREGVSTSNINVA
ncbi:hypothetical protein PkoCFBP13504_19890 [Pseudomonas koreensis]|nr:hypothetical protein PkoCFBP13504_19890 [Pseudomonas koreensis]